MAPTEWELPWDRKANLNADMEKVFKDFVNKKEGKNETPNFRTYV